MIQVGVVMGSNSDWDIMHESVKILEQFNVQYEKLILSAHRTPERMFEYATTAEAKGLKVIIAGAGGAAHLPGMLASKTIVPVLGVPIPSKYLNGLDSLYSIVQMPKGIPVGTLAIGSAGATNAALLAIAILARYDTKLAQLLHDFRSHQTQSVINTALGEVSK